MKVGDYLTVDSILYQVCFNIGYGISFKPSKFYRILKIEDVNTSKPYQRITIESERKTTRLRSDRDYMKHFTLIEKEYGDVVVNFDAFETI